MSNLKNAEGIKKNRLSLVPPALMRGASKAMKDGAEKYGPYNWREDEQGVSASIYYEAALRHLTDWWDGENIAADSRQCHIAHAAACLGILLDAIEGDFLHDDRPLPIKGAIPEKEENVSKPTTSGYLTEKGNKSNRPRGSILNRAEEPLQTLDRELDIDRMIKAKAEYFNEIS